MALTEQDSNLPKTELGPAERSLRARLAADMSSVKTPDWSAPTANARLAQQRKREHQVDPNGVLSEEERAKGAEKLHKAQLTAMSLKSAKNRRLREAKARQPGEASQP
jgi:hypothetical protein